MSSPEFKREPSVSIVPVRVLASAPMSVSQEQFFDKTADFVHCPATCTVVALARDRV
jgi:hypothetical protein